MPIEEYKPRELSQLCIKILRMTVTNEDEEAYRLAEEIVIQKRILKRGGDYKEEEWKRNKIQVIKLISQLLIQSLEKDEELSNMLLHGE